MGRRRCWGRGTAIPPSTPGVTHAGHDTLDGRSLDHLSALLGHASADVTLRYAHLRPQALAEADVARIHVDLVSPRGAVAVLDWQTTSRRTRLTGEANDRKRYQAKH